MAILAAQKSKKESPKQPTKSCIKKIKIPEHITSKKGKMEYLLQSVGENWKKLTCEYALLCCKLPFTKTNKDSWYQTKSRYGRSCKKFSLGLNGLNKRLKRSHHNWHGFIRALQSFDIAEALRRGWIRTKARNHYLLFKNKLGRLEWHPNTRHIRIVVFKPFSRGKRRQLLSDGFFRTELINDIELFMKWSGTARYRGHHTTIETGIAQPYFKEVFHDPFETITIKGGDRSDRTKIEIERELTSLGFHLEELIKTSVETLDLNSKVIQKDGEAIRQFNELMKNLSQPRKKSPAADRMVF